MLPLPGNTMTSESSVIATAAEAGHDNVADDSRDDEDTGEVRKKLLSRRMVVGTDNGNCHKNLGRSPWSSCD